MKEKWKTIKDFADGRYSVSNLGNVRNNVTGQYITGDINNFGYYRVTLYYNGNKKRYMRHRLVAKYFVSGKSKKKKFVNHIDGDKSHNYESNLEWVSQSENEKHAFKCGLKRKTNKPFTVELGEDFEIEFQNQYEASEFFNCSQATISKLLMDKSIKSRILKVNNLEFIS